MVSSSFLSVTRPPPRTGRGAYTLRPRVFPSSLLAALVETQRKRIRLVRSLLFLF